MSTGTELRKRFPSEDDAVPPKESDKIMLKKEVGFRYRPMHC